MDLVAGGYLPACVASRLRSPVRPAATHRRYSTRWSDASAKAKAARAKSSGTTEKVDTIARKSCWAMRFITGSRSSREPGRVWNALAAQPGRLSSFTAYLIYSDLNFSEPVEHP